MKPEGMVFDETWRASCSVAPVPRQDVDWMIRAHYLGKWPGVVTLSLALWHDGQARGVIVFALPPQETNKRYGGNTWELARLWVDDAIPKNGETWFISRAVRFIKRYYPGVQVLVSYADPSVGHQGVIYQAANWDRDGRTDEGRKTPRCDYVDAKTGKKHSRRSHVPADAEIVRVPRVSKPRYIYRLAHA